MRNSLGSAFTLASALGALLGASAALAAPFTVTGNDNTAKTLNAGETGTVSSTGTLSVSGSGNAITLGATSGTTTISNSGSILQTGTGRTIRNNTSGTPAISITNASGALIQSADADTIRADVAGSSWTINNSGIIRSLNPSAAGSQALDFDAVTTGVVSITNNVGGQILAFAADAIRPGANATVTNFGTIAATLNPADADPGSDGVDTQARSGVTVINSGTITGRHGITGGAASSSVLFTTTVTNNVGGTIQALNGSGINLDGFNANQTATIFNHGTIIGEATLPAHDGDGIDVDGLAFITNTGLIRSRNAFGSTSEGITVGGGTITNSGTIEGLVASGNTTSVGRGITLTGNDITTGPLTGTREAIYGNATVTNQAGGLIRGDSDSGIAVEGPASGFTVTIDNQAGATIQGGGASAAAIRTGADDDTVTNAGTIDGSSSGKAIDLGGGHNTLKVTGGTAVILGDVDGGAGSVSLMTMSPGAGNSFSYGGVISNFNTVKVDGGHVTLSGANAYTGSTLITGSGELTLNGANRIATASGLVLDGGQLDIANAGGANGQTFAGLALTGSSTIDLALSSLTFNGLNAVTSGATLTVLNWSAATSPSYALRFFGDLSSDPTFQSLMGATTIDGSGVAVAFDGTYTDVSAVPLPGAGGLLLSALGVLGAWSRRRNRAAAAAC